MKAETVIEIVKKLVGEVDAVGSSHIDKERLENLEVMTKVIDELIEEVISSAGTKDDYRYSMQQIGRYAFEYLKEWRETLEEIVEEGNNGLKPLPKDESHEYYGCSSCRHIVSSVQNYCENCGQKLDWRDIGETE